MTLIQGFRLQENNSNLPIIDMFQRFRDDYGDLIRMRGMLGQPDFVVSFKPEDYEKVFRTEGVWPVRRSLDTFSYYRQKIRPEIYGESGGLANEQGEKWQKMRTITNPVMMNPKTVALYVEAMDEIAREFMPIVTALRDAKNELPENFDEWLNRWALESMGLLALDTRFGVLKADQSEQAKTVIALVKDIFELTFRLDFEPSIWKYYKTATFKRLMRVFDDLTNLIMAKIDDAVVRIEKHPKSEGNLSVLEKLLKVNKNAAVVMSFDMIMAGIDTTSSGTVGVLYCLAKNPDKQAKLRDELRTILPSKDSPLTTENMRNLPYLRACIKEGLRLYAPTFGNFRATGQNLVLQGYRIPKGTDISMVSTVLQRQNAYFHEAKQYIPERWLTERPDHIPSAKDANPFIFLPFGFGARSCVGKRLAMMEMEIIVSRFVRNYEIRWNYPDMKVKANLINLPVSPLKFELKEVAYGAICTRQYQSATVASAKDVIDSEWESAKPFKSIPTPTLMHMYRGFKEGGRYAGLPVIEFHQRLREDFGDLVRIPGLMGKPDVVLSYKPADYEKVFRTEGIWPVRRTLDTFTYYRTKVRPEIFGETGGLANEQGEKWQKTRTITNPVLMQPKTVGLYVDQVDEIAREFMTIIGGLRDAKNELPADFDQWLNRWALETIGVLALDTRFGVLHADPLGHAKTIITLVRDSLDLTYRLDIEPSIWKYYKTPTFKRLMKTLDDLTNLIMTKIDEAILKIDQNPPSDGNQSVLQKLLKVNKTVAVVMSMDMISAGVDTTSSSTIGVLYSLAKNPEKQSRLRDELRAVLPTKDSPFTTDNMRNLPYLRACIKEGMRLYQPTIGNMRCVGRDIVLQGYRIPKGSDLAMLTSVLQRDDQFFHRASQFLPERWLNERPEGLPSAKDTNPFIFLPFGFGARSCIGRRLAMMEMEIIISRFVRSYELRWNYDDLKFKTNIINTPANPLQFQLQDITN
ncbi:cytochrome P450 CYP12A2-like [Anopheles cruzii]|uniref:cytochrome P450 CYP12A2-like n=1 Tax=Anopheles cruzii TaxID=68878 RepID=UPI0022EC8DBE|nr:cytochrome P450 CYP12A2-like [Anopheles cruzii]